MKLKILNCDMTVLQKDHFWFNTISQLILILQNKYARQSLGLRIIEMNTTQKCLSHILLRKGEESGMFCTVLFVQ